MLNQGRAVPAGTGIDRQDSAKCGEDYVGKQPGNWYETPIRRACLCIAAIIVEERAGSALQLILDRRWSSEFGVTESWFNRHMIHICPDIDRILLDDKRRLENLWNRVYCFYYSEKTGKAEDDVAHLSVRHPMCRAKMVPMLQHACDLLRVGYPLTRADLEEIGNAVHEEET